MRVSIIKLYKVQKKRDLNRYPTVDEKKETKDSSFFSRLFKKSTRTGPSGADPSALTGEKIDNEEAVLRIPCLHFSLFLLYLTL